MANVQIENGYTRIANEIFEVIVSTPELNATQLKILMLLWRNSYGFKKKECAMSLTFICNGTSLTRSNVAKNLKELENRNIIFRKTQKGKTSVLSFNKDYDKWIAVAYPKTRIKKSTNKNPHAIPSQENNTVFINDYSKLYQKIEGTFGFLSPMDSQALHDYLDEGFEYEAIYEAIRRTLRLAPNPTFKFMKWQLNDWSSRGIYTLKDIQIIDPFRNKSKHPQEDKKKNNHIWQGLSPIQSPEEVEAAIQEAIELEEQQRRYIND